VVGRRDGSRLFEVHYSEITNASGPSQVTFTSL
jgi:hypothetical protein